MTRSILEAARVGPRNLALLTPDQSLTYQQLANAVLQRAAQLKALGHLDPTRTVAMIARPNRESVECLLAFFAFGVPVLLILPRLPQMEAQTLIERAGASALIDGDSLPPVQPGPTPEPPSRIDPESPMVLVPTSGSSGLRKIVVLSRQTLQASASASHENLPLSALDRWLLCLPLAHVGGLSILTRSLQAGSAVVLFEPGPAGLLAARAELARCLERSQATLISLVPSVLDSLLELGPDWRFPKSVRAVLVGGASTPEQLLERAHQRGVPILTTYGLTEASSQATTTRLGRTPGVWQGIVGSGHPLPGIELAIGSDQRIRLRGPMLCAGTLGPEKSVDSEDWLATDDLGMLGPDGELFVLGRASDRLLTGGENVDPLVVEASLQSLEGVRAACVFGVPDPRFGEIVACALVVAETSFHERQLTPALSERLAAHERPRRLALLEELPLNASGKVDRNRVRQLAIERLRPWRKE